MWFPKVKPWYGLNVNEQCAECRGRMKLRPCMICMKLFCIGCYHQRFAFGHAVVICEGDMIEFMEKTGKGQPIPNRFKNYVKRNLL